MLIAISSECVVLLINTVNTDLEPSCARLEKYTPPETVKVQKNLPRNVLYLRERNTLFVEL